MSPPLDGAPGVAERRVTVPLSTRDGEAPTAVRYVVAGEGGPPVVCLHGIGVDAAGVSFRDLVPALATDRRVLALDFPGHGESDKPDAPYTTAYFRTALERVLDALGIERAALVGTSMGGAVALGTALSAPERVERLVLAASYGLGGDTYWRIPAGLALRSPWAGAWPGVALGSRTQLRAFLAPLVDGPVSEELLDDVERATADPATGRTLRRWQTDEFRAGGLRTDHADALDGLAVPTLLLHGERDRLLPARWSERAARRLPEARYESLRAGHWLLRERPGRTARLIGEWLAE